MSAFVFSTAGRLRSQQHEQRVLRRPVEPQQCGTGTSWSARTAVRATRRARRTCSEPSTLRIRTYFSRRTNGNIVQGLGVRSTESPRAEYRAGNRDLLHLPVITSCAPRAGFAWNMFGDGKTALRGSWGIFYNFPRSTGDGGYPFSGGCPDFVHRQLRWATFNDITSATASNLIENPVNVNIGGYEQPLAKSHNVNIAFQRDVGFSTVAEIAYVGNFTQNHGRTVDINRLPLYVLREPQQPREQRAAQHELVTAGMVRTQAWARSRNSSPTSMPRRSVTTRCSSRCRGGCRKVCRWAWAYTLAKGEWIPRLRSLHG